MRKIILTAALLSFGTSAFAWTTLQEDWHARGAAATAASTAGAAVVPAAFAKWSDPTAADGAKSADDGGLTWADADLKSKDAVGGEMTAQMAAELHALAAWMGTKSADDGGLLWAENGIKSKDDVGGSTMMASAETGKGMGGPIEEAQGYPACSPGPGDDRCIQLYERGVRDQLAAYKASEGAAMGGPFEPAADAKPAAPATQASGPKTPDAEDAVDGETGDGATDTHAGHDMSDGAKPTATPSPNGIGGPIEVRSGYPACSRTVTDSCIQLYERGVDGRRN